MKITGIDPHVEDEFDQSSLDFISFSTDLRLNHDELLAIYPSSDENGKHSFSDDHMIKLFRRARDEKMLRKCIGCWTKKSKREKKRLDRIEHIVFKKKEGKLLGRSFLKWKHHARMVKVKETILICKFGRLTSKRFRGAFSEWKRKAMDQKCIESEAIDKYRVKALCTAFSGWTVTICEAKNFGKALGEKVRTKSKGKVFSLWRRFIQMKKARRERDERAKQIYTVRIMRSHFTLWLATFRRTKKQKTDQLPLNEQFSQTQSYSSVVKPRHEISGCNTAIEVTSADDLSNEANRTHYNLKESTDKENHCPNILPSPLKTTNKKVTLLKSPTPKLVMDMQKRQRDREIRRCILRSKYEQLAVEKEKREEEDRKRKEHEELMIQNSFMQKKAEEEERKRKTVARRKQACRLAILHYRVTLQRKIFNQWTKVLQMMAFNVKKASVLFDMEDLNCLKHKLTDRAKQAYLSWCDVINEKCFQQWRKFKDNEKEQKTQRALKRLQLADDFNERRLLAKSLVAWQEMCDYMKLTLYQVRRKVSRRYRGLILTAWQELTIKARAQRRCIEERATKFGQRLCLRTAIHQWRSGSIFFKKEREMERMIAAKRMQVYNWLGEL
ncbi:hypothetical protein HJC23_000871 [Cyclotella cryptica]|uniref:Sfi1 spindle body domain-containing protein n=1 Tax=Cyclotella cryptica TaxID=29204 RepID=A0ABD3PU85_9STRA|eukprot:CCRYP_011587-RA/>CCRYP_011587-RA protein AED:0.41 eAED:1.00 QI:0/0/0/1/1/1/3/0/611